MGGKKKPTLSQLAKKTEKKEAEKAKAQKKEEVSKKRVEVLDPKLVQDIMREVVKWDLVTPYAVASQYGIRMTDALRVLRALRDRGDLELVSKGHRTEIYVPKGKLLSVGA